MRIVSHHYGHQDVTGYAVCKLEKQESYLYNSLGVQRPENHGTHGVTTNLRPNTQGMGNSYMGRVEGYKSSIKSPEK